jgi:hypothetical protein
VIKVIVELWPGGDESRKKTLATGTIANIATGSLTSGNYFVDLRDKAGRPWRHGTVTGFPRKRLLAWDLLCRALAVCVGDRNK